MVGVMALVMVMVITLVAAMAKVMVMALAGLLTMAQPALEYPDVNALQCFKDLKQEIADIDNYLRGE